MEIMYSMCWEDYSLLNKALGVGKSSSVLSIASGGENALALALHHPKRIVAVDSNPAQIYLLELKIAAINNLEFGDFIGFLGLADADRRSIYQGLELYLGEKARIFWKGNSNLISTGIIHCGKFEKYLSYFRKLVLHRIISADKVGKFLKLDSLKEQRAFYGRHIDGVLWKAMFRIFFSKTVMSSLGRKRSYFEHSRKKGISSHYLEKTAYGLTSIPAKSNPFTHFILSGMIPYPLHGHPYLDRDNFLLLKKEAGRIELVHSSIQDYLSHAQEFDRFNLSDVFEAMPQEEYERILSAIAAASHNGTRICYWNNLVQRNSHASVPSFVRKPVDAPDMVFFY